MEHLKLDQTIAMLTMCSISNKDLQNIGLLAHLLTTHRKINKCTNHLDKPMQFIIKKFLSKNYL